MHLLVCPTAAHHHADLNIIPHVSGVLVVTREITSSLELSRHRKSFAFTGAAVSVATGNCVTVIVVIIV